VDRAGGDDDERRVDSHPAPGCPGIDPLRAAPTDEDPAHVGPGEHGRAGCPRAGHVRESRVLLGSGRAPEDAHA
jgi:hypothetical protein